MENDEKSIPIKMTYSKKEQILELESITKYEFETKEGIDAINQIIINKTYKEKPKDKLCTLGDAVLRLVLIDDKFPNIKTPEDLTNWTNKKEKNTELTNIAKGLHLEIPLRLKGNELHIWNNVMTVAAGDLIEGIIGAMWLDTNKDIKKCREIILKWFDL